MSGKEHFTTQMNWLTVTPIPFNPTQKPSGVLTGTMSATNTIYTNIYPIVLMDNIGLEITWTGTPTGTLSVLASVSGLNFYPLTFNPALTQPAGAAGGYLININEEPFNYFMLQYVNASGSGVLTAWTTGKDIN